MLGRHQPWRDQGREVGPAQVQVSTSGPGPGVVARAAQVGEQPQAGVCRTAVGIDVGTARGPGAEIDAMTPAAVLHVQVDGGELRRGEVPLGIAQAHAGVGELELSYL